MDPSTDLGVFVGLFWVIVIVVLFISSFREQCDNCNSKSVRKMSYDETTSAAWKEWLETKPHHPWEEPPSTKTSVYTYRCRRCNTVFKRYVGGG